jgi:alkanesulfonate monooxygenase SsuD/methylene tetrahydromethanopterin reductase-like flavin-dependent oxidoreductase (luciferase family)
MKFGLFTIVPWHESLTQSQALHDALEQIELADRLGLDEVWLGEHRFSRHGLLSGFFSFAGAVVARTQKVRIGTAVVVLPLHNPILVAEEIAMLDVLSGGRMEIGIGSGYQRQEFDGLGIDMNESRARFREATEVLRKAWTEETLTFHGQFTHVDNLWVLPKPIQKPHPPLWPSAPVHPPSSGPPAKTFSRSWVVPLTSWARLRRCSRCGVTRWRPLAVRMPISPRPCLREFM